MSTTEEDEVSDLEEIDTWSKSDGTDPDVDAELSSDAPRRHRWWIGLGVAALILTTGSGLFLVLAPADQPSHQSARSNKGASTATVAQQTLSALTQVDGTLGYGGTSTVTAPSGTDTSSLQQAEQALKLAEITLANDRIAANDAVRSGARSVTDARSAVTAARNAVAASVKAANSDCKTPTAPACTQAQESVATARDQLTQARSGLISAQLTATSANHQAEAKVDADRASLSAAQETRTTAMTRATNAGTTITALPATGTVVRRGEPVYAVDGADIPLFYGSKTPWRALYVGVGAGTDVAELNDNLAALGFDRSLAGSRVFSAATQVAVEAWQKKRHAPVTGIVALGDFVVRPGQVIVSTVTATVGSALAPGATILSTSAIDRVVTVDLDAAQQDEVKAGDAVTITLPDGKTTAGKVSSVGKVATSAGDSGGDSSGADTGKATISVVIELADPRAASGLDKAPVLVGITTATAKDALVVPVNALLALAGGGYAVEVVESDGHRHLVSVTTGLFDDAKGLVEVTDTELKVGQQVVVPSS